MKPIRGRAERAGRLAVAAASILLGHAEGQAKAAGSLGLEKAQQLFQQNRWADARAAVRSNATNIPPTDLGRARFLVGRSYVLEAEFYRAARRFGIEVGLDYLAELSAAKENGANPWIPLFTGLHRLEAGDDRPAERALSASANSRALPQEWKEVARRRTAVARYRQGQSVEAKAIAADTSSEGHYWRLLLGLPQQAKLPDSRVRGVEPFLGACVLFRGGQERLAEAMLYGLDPDRPDFEDKTDAKKLLRFFDPIALGAQERIQWERALVTLEPLARSSSAAEAQIAAYYAGVSLFFLGAGEEAKRLLESLDARVVGPELHARSQILIVIVSGEGPARLPSLWEATKGDPEAVLLWKEIERPDLVGKEPFATQLGARLKELSQSFPPRPSGAMVAEWGLIRLRAGADPAEVRDVLSRFRNHAEKNKVESNAPLLLLSLAAANYRNHDYAQALETLFELSKIFKGLRGLVWNLQGVYAARHEAAGEARISR